MADRETITIRPPKGINGDKIEERRVLYGMESKSALVAEGLRFMMELDPQAYKSATEAAEGFGIPLWKFFQNAVIDALARLQARADVWGEDRVHHEAFRASPKGMVTGQPLFDELVAIYRAEEADARVEELTQEKLYGPLTEEDQAWLSTHAPAIGPADTTADDDIGHLQARRAALKRRHGGK